MALELGLFWGCKLYGATRQRSKVSLIFDAEPYRYQIFISDIAGQDIHSHGNDVRKAIGELRAWLATASKRTNLPGGRDIFERYKRFQLALPVLCRELKLEPAEVTFKDLRQMMVDWLKQNR